MQFWCALEDYDERRAKLSTGIYRIALNVAISHRRREGCSLAGCVEPLQTPHLDTMGGGEAIDEGDEPLTALYALIGVLDPLNRALILRCHEDRPDSEIADVPGISETHVATRLGRIQQKLRGQMVTAPITGA